MKWEKYNLLTTKQKEEWNYRFNNDKWDTSSEYKFIDILILVIVILTSVSIYQYTQSPILIDIIPKLILMFGGYIILCILISVVGNTYQYAQEKEFLKDCAKKRENNKR